MKIHHKKFPSLISSSHHALVWMLLVLFRKKRKLRVQVGVGRVNCFAFMQILSEEVGSQHQQLDGTVHTGKPMLATVSPVWNGEEVLTC